MRVCWSVVLAGVIVGCAASDREKTATVDSTPGPGAPVAGAAVVRINSEPDSGFSAEGVYIPDTTVATGGYVIRWFEVGRFAVSIRLAPVADLDSAIDVSCGSDIVTADTLILICPSSPIGPIVVNGHFLDRRGRYFEREDTEGSRAVVCRGIVTVSATGAQWPLNFTYWGGD